MPPKDGDLEDITNWGPIAIFSIFFKFSSRLLNKKMASLLFQRESFDQYGSQRGVRIEDALLCAEVAIEQRLEFHHSLWVMSMCMCKTFGTVDHNVIMQAPHSRGISAN